ncbi:MAG: hypothetical protein Q4F13_01765 [Pseudomonadota bacterium]|nr:hypothetical protein [Pseudomonadota bacterium]
MRMWQVMTGMLAGGVLALLALLAAGCAPALNWREVALPPTGAAALLPCQPDRATRTVPLGGEPTDLHMAGCDADGATFALMAVRLPARRAPDALLAGWQQATLANMRAAGPVQRQPFVPAGALALAHAQRVAAQGADAQGRAVAAQAVWTARAVPGTEAVDVLHAVVYAPAPRPDVAEAFFQGLRWP